jgi:uncharacterized membrane protein YeaQ/YmgE (transglycosylase-associated protein family)
MDFLVVLLILAAQGLFIGAFARLALPGRDPLSLLQTMGVGLAGSFLAGIAAYLISDERAAPSFLAALAFSVAIMYFIRRRRGGGLTQPHAEAGGRRHRS